MAEYDRWALFCMDVLIFYWADSSTERNVMILTIIDEWAMWEPVRETFASISRRWDKREYHKITGRINTPDREYFNRDGVRVKVWETAHTQMLSTDRHTSDGFDIFTRSDTFSIIDENGVRYENLRDFIAVPGNWENVRWAYIPKG